MRHTTTVTLYRQWPMFIGKRIILVLVLLNLSLAIVSCTNSNQPTVQAVLLTDKTGVKFFHPNNTNHSQTTTKSIKLAKSTKSTQNQPTPTVPKALANTLYFHGDIQRPEIALTFDDGPSPFYTAQILDILKSYHIHATFFEIGLNVEQYPAITRAVQAGGNVIGNHSWNHPDLTTLSAESLRWQIETTSTMIQTVTGRKPLLIRPPYGSINAYVHTQLVQMGHLPVLWNIDTVDWSRPGTSYIINMVLTQARNGSIILMHDGGGNRSQTVAALPTIISTLQSRGFKFVTVQEMIGHDSSGRSPAKQGTPSAIPPLDHRS
jgi:Predicted xylanase/chitin deacetylase